MRSSEWSSDVCSSDRPASITPSQLAQWVREGLVECLGERSDVAQLYQQAHIVVLPSYREGLPKSLVEAAACGRAVVTTDVPGCRDALTPGVTDRKSAVLGKSGSVRVDLGGRLI